MSSLIEIQQQIELLQKQANEIRAQEFNKTVQEILEKMTTFGITLKDLESIKGRSRKSSPASAKPVIAKFRGPNGETWSGRGLMPRWMSALVAQGRRREEFAIED